MCFSYYTKIEAICHALRRVFSPRGMDFVADAVDLEDGTHINNACLAGPRWNLQQWCGWSIAFALMNASKTKWRPSEVGSILKVCK